MNKKTSKTKKSVKKSSFFVSNFKTAQKKLTPLWNMIKKGLSALWNIVLPFLFEVNMITFSILMALGLYVLKGIIRFFDLFNIKKIKRKKQIKEAMRRRAEKSYDFRVDTDKYNKIVIERSPTSNLKIYSKHLSEIKEEFVEEMHNHDFKSEIQEAKTSFFCKIKQFFRETLENALISINVFIAKTF